MTLNVLGCLCVLEWLRTRSLKAITKKSCLITPSIRAWSHRQLCAETKGWCWILSVCLVPSQWSSIKETAKTEREREEKKNNIQPKIYSQYTAKFVQPSCWLLQRRGRWACPWWAVRDDSHATEPRLRSFRCCLCDRTSGSLKHYHIGDESRIMWDQKYTKGQYLLIFSIQLATSMHKAAFLLFQEIIHSLCWAAAAKSTWQPCSSLVLVFHQTRLCVNSPWIGLGRRKKHKCSLGK